MGKLEKARQSQQQEIEELKATIMTLMGKLPTEWIYFYFYLFPFNCGLINGIISIIFNFVEFIGFDQKVTELTNKVDAITGVYEDINEKMFEIDKTRKNNLLFYGIKPDFLPEIQTQLEKKVHEIMRYNLHINRNVPVVKIARMMTGPEVRGSRPILVNFAYWKDREEVLSKSRLLRGSNIYITEDLSRRMRETRHHLTKYMRDVSWNILNKFWIMDSM